MCPWPFEEGFHPHRLEALHADWMPVHQSAYWAACLSYCQLSLCSSVASSVPSNWSLSDTSIPLVPGLLQRFSFLHCGQCVSRLARDVQPEGDTSTAPNYATCGTTPKWGQHFDPQNNEPEAIMYNTLAVERCLCDRLCWVRTLCITLDVSSQQAGATVVISGRLLLCLEKNCC